MASRVLIADDEANLLISLEYLLQRQGYDVSLARDGDQTMKLIRQQPPDLVILDATMPGQSGFEVCQQVRADPALRHIPIVMLSARARETDIAKGKALGADAYIVKPFSTADLVNQVRQLLGADR
ncbi:response regulator [Wenzhouxiangella sp. XN24]|uniref:response regulator transcription factor n=1 Tax=Wenzhouxiangella sp. XN24 TaxID=2713569 RepID=UPI0013ECD6C4|nr:response regulator [Wenzhouxiangella sp. XN24]NGX17720.1 response regulator [Wenzhouxiangella sp. XN24]